jgi:hypothetical protein
LVRQGKGIPISDTSPATRSRYFRLRYLPLFPRFKSSMTLTIINVWQVFFAPDVVDPDWKIVLQKELRSRRPNVDDEVMIGARGKPPMAEVATFHPSTSHSNHDRETIPGEEAAV